MVHYKNKIFFFADLDDSMFQTIGKNKEGKFKATFPKNILKTSYYTKAQNSFLNFILSNEDIVFVPLTARTKEQYERTKIFRNNQADIYSNYYGAKLMIKNVEYNPYCSFIKKSIQKSDMQIKSLLAILNSKYPNVQYDFVDGYYITISTFEKMAINYVKKLILRDLNDLEFYHEEKYLTILPKSYNKSSVVKYLTKKFNPKFSIGIGNSISDIDFLNLCDFKIVSHIGILHNKLNT